MVMTRLRTVVLGMGISIFCLYTGMYAFDAQGQEQGSASTITNLSVPAYLQSNLPSAGVVGQSRLKMYFFKIYDATLYAPFAKFDQGLPFALSLAYLRDFEGADIAQRSIDEMRDLGYQDTTQLAQWLIQIELSFPNITEGDVLTGFVDAQQHTQFYFNGHPTHLVADPEFTQAFFAIWLDPNTSQPKMRKQLLGERK